MMPLDKFIADYGITARAERTDKLNPDWGGYHHAYMVTLRNSTNGKRMTVPFYQGIANTEPPTAADVLDCLASDMASYENTEGSFEDWCEEFGFDTDSRKAERTYKAVERQSKRLEIFLGGWEVDTLLWGTERL